MKNKDLKDLQERLRYVSSHYPRQMTIVCAYQDESGGTHVLNVPSKVENNETSIFKYSEQLSKLRVFIEQLDNVTKENIAKYMVDNMAIESTEETTENNNESD